MICGLVRSLLGQATLWGTDGYRRDGIKIWDIVRVFDILLLINSML
jgi:hypothetical protein